MVEVPEIWKEILQSLQNGGIKAIIAGGCVRDFILQRPIKDIDVFVPVGCGFDMWLPVGTTLVRKNDLSYAPFSDGMVKYTTTLEYKGNDVQIIEVDMEEFSADELMARVDFTICQATYDMELGVYVSPSFLEDTSAKEFVLIRADNQDQYDYSMKRYERLTAEKYKGWGFVDGRKQ
jgi:predicted nucleotidyltransferase